MDGESIRKVIRLNNNNCPDFTYENPLLERKVANLFATSVMKLLNSNRTHSDFRKTILKKIRKLCRDEPGDHLCIDDDVTEILIRCHEDFLKSSDKNLTIEETLDTFLIRELKEMNISSIHTPSITPETIQALNNLKGSRKDTEAIRLKYINWNILDTEKNLDILKSIWEADILSNHNDVQNTELVIPDNSAIKMKPLIEKLLLKTCYEILNTHIVDLKDWCEVNIDLMGLVKMCAESSEWFQICSSILNTIFIKVNFDKQLQEFIYMFINESVRVRCSKIYFSVLYPNNLSHLVTLLDINIGDLPTETKESYISSTVEYLNKLHNECENDFVMLLSHFNQWFSIYYERQVT